MYVVIETGKHREVVFVEVFTDRSKMIESVKAGIGEIGLYSLGVGELKPDEVDRDVKAWVDDSPDQYGHLEYEHSGGGFLSIWKR